MKRSVISLLLICLLASTGNPAQSNDSWISIRTPNLFLISNASQQDLRQAALWLELFHDAFGRLISKSVIDSSVPTTVILFKDDESFLPFKPIYQGKPANVAGYFQAGQDVNYIALSLDWRNRSPFGAAFHEYVHLHVKDSAPEIPLWLNEGLAEFYGAFSADNGEAVFGSPLPHYLHLLRNRDFLSLSELFSVGYSSPHYNEQEKGGIFYAESWALVHYLMTGEGGRLRPQMTRYLGLLSAGVSNDNAIKTSFGMDVETLEKALRNYVNGRNFASLRLTMSRGPDSYMAMQRAPLSEAEANFYLGDLLLHIHRTQTAERYFLQAISLDPGLTSAHASLGLLRVQQNRLAEAKKHLQRATTTRQTYLVHYFYAWVLSQERNGADGTFSPETANLMRDQLHYAIKLAPNFGDAQYLLAFVNVVNGEQLDEAVKLLKKAQSLVPGRLSYSLLLAFAYLRQQDVESARSLFDSLARQTGDSQVRAEAQRALDSINSKDKTGSRDGSSGRPTRVGVPVNLDLGQPSVTTLEVTPGQPTGGLTTEDGRAIEESGSLPPVEQIIKQWVEAVGGEKKLRATTSRVAKGTVDLVGVSRGGALEIYSKAPNKSLTIMKAEPMGEIKLGFNGSIGWEHSIRGFRFLKGVELDSVRRNSDYYSPLGLRDNYQSIKLLGKSKIGYVEVYALELKPNLGAAERLYLDANTHLPMRMNTLRTTSLGPTPAEIYFDDWKEVDGLQMPFRISQRFPSLTIVFQLNEVQHNSPINDSIFEAPRKTPLKRNPGT